MYSKKQYINGELVEGQGRPITVVSPGTGETVGEVRSVSPEQAQRALEAARDAFPAWSALTLEKRGQWMMKLKAEILAERDKLAEMMAWESGKFIEPARREVTGLAESLDFFLTQARSNFDETVHDPLERNLFLMVREPLGVVVAYIAWNFPLTNLAKKFGAMLVSGCTSVVKPATRTPLSTLYLGELMHRIGFPAGVMNFVAGSAGEVSGVLTQSTIPAMVTLIGSSRAGRELVRDSATSIKRFSLELGGNAPVIVTPNADVNLAAVTTMGGKMSNCGQSCVSPQRVIVHRSVHDQFVAAAREVAATARVGTVYDEANTSPMISPEAVTRLEELVADALSQGATLVVGGKRPEDLRADRSKGNYYLSTILTHVTPKMRVFREEIFGPLLPVMAYDDLSEAIALGNDTEYGLYAYAWSRDIVEASTIARALRFGSVSINGGGGGIAIPHGGIKESGVGKDGSKYGLEEYYYIKAIRVPVSDGPARPRA